MRVVILWNVVSVAEELPAHFRYLDVVNEVVEVPFLVEILDCERPI